MVDRPIIHYIRKPLKKVVFTKVQKNLSLDIFIFVQKSFYRNYLFGGY
jgi:hypothetical protein